MRRARPPAQPPQYHPHPIYEQLMREVPCPYAGPGQLQARREREAGSAHRSALATAEHDKAFVDTWHRLYKEGPLGKWDLPESMNEQPEPPPRESCPGVLDEIGSDFFGDDDE